MRFSIAATMLTLSALLGGVGCGGAAATPAEDPAEIAREREAFLKRPPPPKNVDVENLCTESVRIFVGEDPNGSAGERMDLTGGGKSQIQRRADGSTFTLWLQDERGAGLAKVNVTKRMSRVEIGVSCRTLHAE